MALFSKVRVFTQDFGAWAERNLITMASMVEICIQNYFWGAYGICRP